MPDDPHNPSDEMTIPSRQKATQRHNETPPADAETTPPESSNRSTEKPNRAARLEGLREKMNRDAPWALQQYLQGQIDLDKELATRFPAMPLMSQIHLRAYGSKVKLGVATIATQDNAASLLVDVEGTRSIQFTFLLNSMLGLKFVPGKLSDMDRAHWMDTMRRSQMERRPGDIAFMWGAARWDSDYVICAARKHFTNIYAFSPQRMECAARLTADVTNKLLDWLDGFWTPAEDDTSNAPKLNTW
ncbi:MAG: hypothetical protein L0Z53_21745 [Acidobacteriales bacterium]|nr:hypothetical protein [Terriglobales bacterium]